MARASRVCSSTTLSASGGARRRSRRTGSPRADTWLGRSARNSSAPGAVRRRLRRHGAGRLRPSARHRRWVRLMAQPSLSGIECAVFQPQRGWARAMAPRRRRSLASASGMGRAGRRWLEPCWPVRRHARRSETPKLCEGHHSPTARLRGQKCPSASSLSIALSSSASARSVFGRSRLELAKPLGLVGRARQHLATPRRGARLRGPGGARGSPPGGGPRPPPPTGRWR